MREVEFYRTRSDRCPVQEFLESLPPKKLQKVLWVLRLICEMPTVPRQYFKKLVETDGIWEVRVKIAGDSLRLLGFFVGDRLIVLTNAFAKKDQKVPQGQIWVAQQRRREFLDRS